MPNIAEVEYRVFVQTVTAGGVTHWELVDRFAQLDDETGDIHGSFASQAAADAACAERRKQYVG